MASYQVVVCSDIAPSALAVNVTGSGQPGAFNCGGSSQAWSISMSLPDSSTVYGLPDISPADVAIISFGIASVWASAFVIKKMMSML